MPEQGTFERARAAEGKSPSTQAGEFVREEIEHVREGKHGARSTQAGDRDRIVQGTASWGEAAAAGAFDDV